MTSHGIETVEQLNGQVAELQAQVEELQQRLEQDKRKENLLRRKEEVLHAALDSTADGILAVDEIGHVVFANKQFAKMWHIPPDLIEAGDDDELLQFALAQLVAPEEFLDKVRALYQSFQRSSDILHFKDGRVFERFSLPLAIEAECRGRVWTFRDITPHGPTEEVVSKIAAERIDSLG